MMRILFVSLACSSSNAIASSIRGAAANGTVSSAPRLPMVDRVMGPAQRALKFVTGDSEKLSALVESGAQLVRSNLTAEKKKYDATIAKNSRLNKLIYQRNQVKKAGINRTSVRLEQLRQRCSAVENSSKIMRSSLLQLRSKVGLALKFLGQYEDQVGGLGTNETLALRPTTPEPSLDYFLNRARKELGLSRASLLQISSADPSEVPKLAAKFVPRMEETLGRLQEAEAHGLEKLRQVFQQSNETQLNQRAALLNVSRKLDMDWKVQNATEMDLHTALSHLNSTNEELRQRLQGFSAFARSVDRVMEESLKHATAASADIES